MKITVLKYNINRIKILTCFANTYQHFQWIIKWNERCSKFPSIYNGLVVFRVGLGIQLTVEHFGRYVTEITTKSIRKISNMLIDRKWNVN